MTLEDLYPVCRPYLDVIRDPKASAMDRHNAAEWLLEHDFERHPLAPKDEILSAYYALATPPSLES